ncbi:MAG: hypothetical protein K2X11_12705 [Acetobacteraceae bacterium]|nr:hypothetical protein [Acetobacteraceae bacterium]
MRRLALLAVLALAASCARPEEERHFTYVPPQGPRASDCVLTCEIERRQCGLQAENMRFACQANGTLSNYAFSACQASNAGNCLPPPLCMSVAGTCMDQYNACFASCGGMVFRTPRSVTTPGLADREALPGRAGAGMRAF